MLVPVWRAFCESPRGWYTRIRNMVNGRGFLNGVPGDVRLLGLEHLIVNISGKRARLLLARSIAHLHILGSLFRSSRSNSNSSLYTSEGSTTEICDPRK